MHAVLTLIGNRVDSAVKVQEVLSQNGDIIKTRLGMNRELSNEDDASGFIFLEVCGDGTRVRRLCDDLNSIHDVKAQPVQIELP